MSLYEFNGGTQPTFTMTSTDAALPLDHLLSTDGSSRYPISAMITVETKTIRFTLGSSEATKDYGHRLDDGDVLYLNSYAAMSNFYFISDTTGQAATLFVTLGY